MRPIATDVAHNVVCVCEFMSCAKTAELIEMPFCGLTHVSPSNHVLEFIRWGSSSLHGKLCFWGGCVPVHCILPMQCMANVPAQHVADKCISCHDKTV